MSQSVMKWMAAAVLISALAMPSVVSPAFAAGSDEPSAPPATKSAPKDSKKAKKKHSSIDDPAFLQGYRHAYATIYDNHDYTRAIEQLTGGGLSTPTSRITSHARSATHWDVAAIPAAFPRISRDVRRFSRLFADFCLSRRRSPPFTYTI